MPGKEPVYDYDLLSTTEPQKDQYSRKDNGISPSSQHKHMNHFPAEQSLLMISARVSMSTNMKIELGASRNIGNELCRNIAPWNETLNGFQ